MAALSPGDSLLLPWSALKAHGGDAAVCVAVAGLLAVETIERISRQFLEAHFGKSPVAGLGRRFVRGHLFRATAWGHTTIAESSTRVAAGQCVDELSGLFGEDILADGSGSV